VDQAAADEARRRQERLTKPSGSLGRLEAVGAALAAVARTCPPPVPEHAAVAVFAADHGVVARGVTPWPQEVTAQMVANFLAGGAAVSVLARRVGAEVVVVDAGVATTVPGLDPADPPPQLVAGAVRRGTADLAAGPAMTPAEAGAALDLGASVAAALVARGARCLLTGDMGIGNTTASAALVAAFTGRSPSEVTGRGTGIDDAALAAKVAAVEAGLARLDPGADPVGVLAEVGGLEVAALAGYVVGAAAAGVPVLLDGLIAGAAALAATALVPEAGGYLFAGHRSTEPGASAALAHLGLEPLLDLGLRLGEGTGACLALPLLQGAAAVLGQMATFDGAGVDERPA
jgi:nicotinate-nucleotide--dimethylbenzimidazole phosphoribosyltransferase